LKARHGVLANYASQIYVALIGLAVVPLYLRHLGAEAFGLIGFFTMLQAWFQLLDLGLAPTLAREAARYRGGATSAAQLRAIFRALQLFFGATAVLGALLIVAGAPLIASDWMQLRSLSTATVAEALVLMGLAVPLRWMAGLYRGAIGGFERFVWLAGFNAGAATLRFVGVLFVLHVVGWSPFTFFAYQLALAVLELAALAVAAQRLLPAGGDRAEAPHAAIRRVLKFSLSLSATGVIWVLLTQLDKLLLSRLIPLHDYGYFTLAATVANGITLLAAPISQTLMPQLARLNAENDAAALLAAYRGTTELIAVITMPATLLLAFFATPVLYAWTGDPTAASQMQWVLALYAIGNCLLGFAAFPYYLQYARGNLRWHLLGNALLVALLLPLLVPAAGRFGALGAAAVWCGLMALYLFGWVAWSHAKVMPGLHGPWLKSFAFTALWCTLVAAALAATFTPSAQRPVLTLQLIACWLLLTVTALTSSPRVRSRLRSRLDAPTAVMAP
jgi:O-antigen/teichoic acid export membrane protein